MTSIQGSGPAPLDAASAASAASAAAAATPTTAPDLGPEHPLEKVMAGAVGDLFANKVPLRAPEIEDFRSPAAAAAAVAEPLATPGDPPPFGPATVFRPGLGNTHASPAFIFRMAQYTDRLLLAYPNAKPGEDLAPRPATEIDGVPVPPELRGKIFVSGDPANRMIPWDTASQLFERQLAAASGSSFLGGAPIDGAKVTVIAHSQGGLDAAETRRRLEQEGKGGEIGRVVTLDSPFGGSPLAAPSGSALLSKALDCAVGGETPAALEHLDPAYVKSRFGPGDQRLVDLAITATVDGENPENIRPLMRGLATANKFDPFSRSKGPGDGFVSEASMRFGEKIVSLPDAYDHAGIAEDPAVVDAVALGLAGSA
jgi:hypothetical protein